MASEKPLMQSGIAPLLKAVRAWIPAEGTSFDDQRALFEMASARLSLPEGVLTIPVDVGCGVRGEWIVPPSALRSSSMDFAQALLYFHGGGYCLGSLDTARPLAARLATATGSPLLSIRYRLAPEHPFPAAMEDALVAWEWMRRCIPEVMASVSIVGDSAGGGLAVSLAQRLVERGEQLPAGIVTISPWVDLCLNGASLVENGQRDPVLQLWQLQQMASAYAGDNNCCHPSVSPLYDNFYGLPPLLIQVGLAEMLLDDGRSLAHKALSSGVSVHLSEWPEMIHVWHVFSPRMHQSSEALNEIAGWIDEL